MIRGDDMNTRKIISVILGIILVLSLAFNVYLIVENTSFGYDKSESSLDYGYSSEPSYESEGFQSADGSKSSTDQMLIMNSSITIIVKDNEKKDEEIRTYIKQHNGKLINSNAYQYDKFDKVFTLQVKIPQEDYDAFMDYLKDIGDVDYFSENSYDVYDQYQDNELRIEMFENKLSRLYELLDSAKDINDLIIIENSISDTIYQIEYLKGIQDNLEYESDYATITITLKPIVKEVVEPSGLDGIFSEAFTISLNAFLKFIEWLIRILFFVLPYGLIGIVGYIVYRKLIKK